MAKIIGEAGIRLTASSKGLALEFRRIITSALKEASAGISEDTNTTKQVEKDAEKSASKVRGILSGLANFGQGISAQLGSGIASSLSGLLTTGANLVFVGAKAGLALAAVTSLATGIVGLIGVMGQAAGVAGLLPAALIGIKTVSAVVKVALDGVGESFKALASGDTQAFNESLKGLAPNAQKFVKAIAQVKPAFDQIKLTTQDVLFSHLTETIKPLAQRYLPIIRDTMFDIGITANGAAQDILNFANNGEVAGQTSILFQNIAKAAANLRPAIEPALSAFLDIGQVGSDFLPGITQSIANLATQFGDFIREAAASGKLSDFFQKAIDTVKQLGQIIFQFGAGFAAVFKAANQAGGGLLNNLLDIATAFNRFASSAEGQSALISFFQSMHSIIQAVLPVVLSLAQVIARDLAPILANLAATIGPAFLSVAEGLGTALRAAGPGIATFAKGIADLITAAAPLLGVFGQIAGIFGQALGGALSEIAPVFQDVANVLANSAPAFQELAKGFADLIKAAAPLFPIIAQLAAAFAGALGQALQAIAPVLAQVGQTIATSLVAILPTLTPVLIQMAQGFASLLTAALPLIPSFLQIVQAVLPLLPPLLQLVASIMPSLVTLVQALTPLITALASVFSNLIPIFQVVVDTILGVLIPPIQLIATVVSAVAQIVAQVFSAIAGTISTVLGGIASFVTGIWGSIVNIFTGAVNTIKNFITGGFNAIRDFFGRILGDIASAVGRGIENVIGFFRDLPGKVLGFLGDIASKAVKAGEDIVGGIIRGLGNFAGKIIDKITSLVSDAWDAVVDFFDIFSPSKLAIRTFEFVGEGMVIGLDNMAGDVKAAATDLSKTAFQGLTDPLGNTPINFPGLTGGDGAVLPGLGGGFVLQQTNVMQPGTDATQFANEVWKRGVQELNAGNALMNVSQQSVQSGVALPGSVVNVGV